MFLSYVFNIQFSSPCFSEIGTEECSFKKIVFNSSLSYFLISVTANLMKGLTSFSTLLF